MLTRFRALPWLVQFVFWLAIVVLIILILGLVISALGGGSGDLHIGKFFLDVGVKCSNNC